MKLKNLHYLEPVLLLFLILIDSQLDQAFRTLTGNAMAPIFHLFLIFLIYASGTRRLSYLILVSLLLGYIYDSYYIGVIGLSTAILPILSLLVYQIKKTVFHSYLTRLFATIIVVFLFEVSLPLIQLIFGLVSIDPIQFVVRQLAPTLLLNIFLAAMLIGPLDRLYGYRKNRVERGVIHS